MRLGSNDPIEPTVAPTTRGGLQRVIVGLMALLLVFGAGAFFVLGETGRSVPRLDQSPSAPVASSTPIAATASPPPTATPTPIRAGVPGTCRVSEQAACDSATFAVYQPAAAAGFRAAMLHEVGVQIYAPADGVIAKAGAAQYLDDTGQPRLEQDSFIEVRTANGLFYQIIFRYDASSFVVGQRVRAGDLLGTTKAPDFALEEPALAIFAVLSPGAGGIPTVDPARMVELFPGY